MYWKRTTGTLIFMVGAAAALILDLPGRFFEPAFTLGHELQHWMRFILVATAVGLPFDFLAYTSRQWLEGQDSEEGVKALIRADMLLAIIYVAIGALCLAASEIAGPVAAMLAIGAVLGLLIMSQYFLLVVSTRTRPALRSLTFAGGGPDELYELNAHVLNAGIKDFTGGFAGLFRLRRLVLPEQDFRDEEMFPRRKARYWLYEVARGYRMGATLLSLMVLLTIALLILLLPGTGFNSAAELARFSLWSTMICAGTSLVLGVPYERITKLGFLMRRRGREWSPMSFSQDLPRVSLEPKRPGDPYPEGSTFLTAWPSTFRLCHYLSWGILNLAARLHPQVAGHPTLWVMPPDERTLYLPSSVTDERAPVGRS